MRSKYILGLIMLGLIFFCFVACVEESTNRINNNGEKNIISSLGFSPDSKQYLSVSGFAKYPENDDFNVQDLLTLDYPQFDLPSGKGPYVIELLDKKNRMVSKYRFDTSPMRISTADNGDRIRDSGMFAFSIPVSSKVNKILIKKGKAILIEEIRSLNFPKVEFIKPENNSEISGIVEIEWAGNDPDGDSLVYRLESSDDCGENWFPQTGFIRVQAIEREVKYLCGQDAIFRSISEESLKKDCDGGSIILRILCSDGLNTFSDVMYLSRRPI